jgi:hypothetical protein
VRRVLTTKRELASIDMDSIPSVSSVLRGAEGSNQNKQIKKILKKSVVITKSANQAGLTTVSY